MTWMMGLTLVLGGVFVGIAIMALMAIAKDTDE